MCWLRQVAAESTTVSPSLHSSSIENWKFCSHSWGSRLTPCFSSTTLLPSRQLRRRMMSIFIISYIFSYISGMLNQVTSVPAVLWYEQKSLQRLLRDRISILMLSSVFPEQGAKYSFILTSLVHNFMVLVVTSVWLSRLSSSLYFYDSSCLFTS